MGIGEVLRRIIGKAISRVLQSDMVGATAPIQVCARQSGGVEAAVHDLRWIFNDEETEAIISVKQIMHSTDLIEPQPFTTYNLSVHILLLRGRSHVT